MREKLGTAIVLILLACSVAEAQPSAEDILKASGIKGGLVVTLGCGDGRLTAALHANHSYLVHGLDTSQENVASAREHVRSQGLYGKVSIERLWTTELPYNDNLVNLIVVSDSKCGISHEEIMRVLAPGGVVVTRDSESLDSQEGFRVGRDWKAIVKPWPDEIDEWTHFLYDASNNAVAKDSRVGPSRHLQWTAGPKRTRDHDALSSFTTMTSSKGRVFYILDEGPTSQIHRQPRWRLVSRDAFNGVPLWKREISSWVNPLYNFRAGPVQMTRRLVSADDRVYVTLGFDAPVTALDATNGKTLLTFAESQNTEEILLDNGVLLTVVGDPKIFDAEAPRIHIYQETRVDREPRVAKSIVAYQARTGELLWRKSERNLAYLVPLSLTAGDGKVLYLDHKYLHCVDLKSGRQLWASPFGTEGLFLRNYAPTVVMYKDVAVCLSTDRLAAFDANHGKQLWRKEQGYYGFASPGDLFVIDDLVWTFPGTAAIKYGDKKNVLGNAGKEFWALDLYTGEVKQSIAKTDAWPGGHHHRCYRNKATENFAVCGRRGLEFIDLTGGDKHVINWWARGICQYGIMPCNGMVYVPPDPCRCFSTFKVDGLLALAADSSLDDLAVNETDRLRTGPAYLKVVRNSESGRAAPESSFTTSHSTTAAREDWPTYRRDMNRSGATNSSVPGKLTKKWETQLSGTLSSVVVAQNRVLISEIDQFTLHCLAADTGQPVWKFTTNGSIDSPPTVCDELVLFGSRDGRVYALSAHDGRLAWSYRAAPVDRRIVDDGTLESVWPVHGSVLVLDGVVYFAAGRSSFLDGGIHLFGLDVRTGEKRYETQLDSSPAHGKNSGALPDVLMSNGTTITMRQLSFKQNLQSSDSRSAGSFSASTGLLEDCWGHRLTWRSGQAAGNLLVFNDETIYGAQSQYAGWKKNKANWPPTHTGHLHQKYSRYEPEWFPIGNRLFSQERRTAADRRGKRNDADAASHWSRNLPIQIRAMVLAGDTLLAAGWPDTVTVFDQVDPNVTERELRSPRLWTFSVEDGSQIAEYQLDSLPVFDGAAVARGQLFMAMQDGRVVCMGR